MTTDRLLIPALVAAALLSWSLLWVARYPAVMTPDSIDQWNQVLTGHYNDWHPVAHTLLLRVVAAVWPSPASGVAVQMLIMAGAMGYTLVVVRELAQGWIIPTVVGAFFVLLPVHGALQTTLWKDVVFSSAFMVFTASIVRFLYRDGKGPVVNDWLVLGISGLGVCLLRHNGFVGVLAGMAALAAALPAHRWHHLTCLLITLVSAVTWQVFVWNVLHVPAPSIAMSLAIPLQQTAAIVDLDGRVTSQQRESLSAILPWPLWKERYDRSVVGPLIFDPQFRSQAIADHPASFLRVWWNLCRQNPGLALRGWLRQTAVIWYPAVDARDAYPTGITANTLGLKPAPPWPALTRTVDQLFQIVEKPPWSWAIRPSWLNAVLFLAAALCLATRGAAALAPFAPWAAGTIVLLFLIPSPDFRYFYPTICVVPLLLVWTATDRLSVRPSDAMESPDI